jgi:AraC family transcriptional regulator of adaptative response/methylated-DNA-[protein]-cysteine methyltransferase
MAENSLPSPSASNPVTRACRLLEHAEPTPSLSELAQAVGKSVSQLHRLFKAQLGLTPRQYALAQRAARLRAQLPTARTVTEAMHEAGFASSGRFYAHATRSCSCAPPAR